MSLPIKFFYWLPFYDCLLRCSYHFPSLRKGERFLHPCLCEISQGKSTYKNSDKLNNHVEWVVKDALIINWGKQCLKYCPGPETRLVGNVNYRLQSVRWIQTPTRVGLWWIQKKCVFSVFMIATKRKSRMPSDCEIEAGSKILLCATTFRRSIFVIIKQVNKLEIRYEFGRKKKTRKKERKLQETWIQRWKNILMK